MGDVPYLPQQQPTRNRLAEARPSSLDRLVDSLGEFGRRSVRNLGMGAEVATNPNTYVDWLAGGAQAGAEPTMALMRGDALDQPFLPTATSGGRVGAIASALGSTVMPVKAPAGAMGAGPVMRTADAALDMAPEARAARAAEMGFTTDAYHGTGAGDIPAFDKSKIVDNSQYGGSFYFSPTPEYANRYAEALGNQAPAVYPVKLRMQKPFKMDEPVSAEDAAAVLRAIGRDELADKILQGGKGYRSGSDLFYFGMGQDKSARLKADALRQAGFDGVAGDPGREIGSGPGRPHIMVFEPEQVRSRFAAFDPARAGESDLMASRAGVPAVRPPRQQPEDPATAAAQAAWIQQHLAAGGM